MEHTESHYLNKVIKHMPEDWLKLTTHRLDIYNESLAKVEFLEQFEQLFNNNSYDTESLLKLPTAYDYIRLGHPLSCILEWYIAKQQQLHANNVICFSSETTPILAVLRHNLLSGKNTQIVYTNALPKSFDAEILRRVYGYRFDVKKIDENEGIPNFDGSTIFIDTDTNSINLTLNNNVDFHISIMSNLGSIILINDNQNESYVSEIQHARRRETIAMTPADTLTAIQRLLGNSPKQKTTQVQTHKTTVLKSIAEITRANTEAAIASSGLSMQYAIVMGLVHDALENHKGKTIKFIVPPNCYGGTNDQARRVAACIDNVEVIDLPVDGGNNMVKSIDAVLNQIAKEDAVAYIIAEIPTNPRVEVPELNNLKTVLDQQRLTASGKAAVKPVFVLDQTFCPNTHFLGDDDILASTKVISYVSGSKFPSGGKCTAGYCVANTKAADLMNNIHLHLNLCDNEATDLQMEILAKQLPSMNQRIHDAYVNTREFVNFIKEQLPTAKINFVSEELAKEDFTPSVFSLDLPTKGDTEEEKEAYKRALNLRLINLMITKIPHESKYCVSYGQLKGCYWTIPATSTQGTTKEGDKDYIARVAISPNMDMELHKSVFLDFVKSL
ncbi:MAG: cystathionine beta-synthase [Flavobacteriaceae bacterium]